MKVIHCPFTFAPDPCGGTEIYVESLAHALARKGIASVIVAPLGGFKETTYEHNGIRVRRFRSASTSKRILQELYGEGDLQAAKEFLKILREERPDVVHIHSFTRAVSILLVKAAKQQGCPVFFTYHTPTVSCQRGTLMLWGNDVCDGRLNVERCTACSLQSRGLPRWVSVMLSQAPFGLQPLLERANLSGGIWTALRMSTLVQMQHEAFRLLMHEANGVVALSDWVRGLLVRNGVPEEKITLSRHGLSTFRSTSKPHLDVCFSPLHLAFLGRVDKVKGVDTLIEALRAAPDLSVRLDLYGVTQGASDEGNWNLLKRVARDDSRINFLPAVPNDQVVSLLRGYHYLAVPSRWLETGPLVILEAFAAGTPVIGSKLGGIADLVRDEKNGLLIEPENVKAWTNSLRRCVNDRGLLSKLRRGISKPRSMIDVAKEMSQMYCQVLDSLKSGGSRVCR